MKTMKGNRLALFGKTERKEGENRIYNLIILDESGTMESIYMQALTGASMMFDKINSRNCGVDIFGKEGTPVHPSVSGI